MSNEYIIERRMKHNKLRRKARRGEIAVRRICKLIRFLCLVFILFLIYRVSLSHYWYLPKDIYTNPKTDSIEILGNKIVSRNKIIDEMRKIPVADIPIYKIQPAIIAENIEKLTPIKRAYVRRFWFPARIIVMVEELTPAITISPTETAPAVLAFATTGETISKEYLPFNNNISTVKILSYGTQGDDYEEWNKEKIDFLYKLAKYITSYSGETIEYIDLRQPHDVFVKLPSALIRLGELDESVFERIKPINDILPEIKILKENVKYVDLAWETKYLKLNK